MASVTDHFWEFMLLWVRIFKVLRTKSLTFGTKALVCVLILCFCLLQWPNFILGSNIFWKEGQRLEWKDIPEVKGTTACSSKGPKFSFQYLCNILLSLYFPFHGLWCSPLSSTGTRNTRDAQTYIQAKYSYTWSENRKCKRGKVHPYKCTCMYVKEKKKNQGRRGEGNERKGYLTSWWPQRF